MGRVVFVRDALLKCESSGSVNQPPGPGCLVGTTAGKAEAGSWKLVTVGPARCSVFTTLQRPENAMAGLRKSADGQQTRLRYCA